MTQLDDATQEHAPTSEDTRAPAEPGAEGAGAHPLLSLQRLAGNAAVASALGAGPPGDDAGGAVGLLRRRTPAELSGGSGGAAAASPPSAPTARAQTALVSRSAKYASPPGGATAIRRFVAVKEFATRTTEGTFTRKSTAQVQIETYLTQYAALGAVKEPKGTKKPAKGAPAAKVAIPDNKLDQAIELIGAMKTAAELWIKSKTIEETASDGSTQVTVDPSRKKRAAGMAWFVMAADGELRALKDRKDRLGVDQDEVTVDEKGKQKLKDRYDGDISGALGKAATVLGKVVPNQGDSTEFQLDVRIPVSPGVFVGSILKFEAKKDGNVEVGLEASFQAGGSVGIGDVNGALGGYLKASAADPQGVMKLISYGFYRRCRESQLPGEVANTIWGGGSGDFAKKKAEKWSLGVEEDLLDNDENFVEMGGLAQVGAQLDVGVAEIQAGAKYTSGKRYDKKSLDNRKGGAGEENVGSDGAFTKNVANKFGRGAQKSTGRSVNNLELSAAASVLGGALSGAAKLNLSWRDQGLHESERETATENVVLEELEINFDVRGSMPMGDLDSKIVALAGDVVKYGKAKTAGLFGQATVQGKPSKIPTTEIMLAKGITDVTFEGVEGLPFNDWVKNSMTGTGGEAAASGGAATGSAMDKVSKIGLELGFKLVKKGTAYEGQIELRHVKAMSAELPELIKAELTRKTRLGGAKYAGGAWTALF